MKKNLSNVSEGRKEVASWLKIKKLIKVTKMLSL
jgi:hypothetical protein